MNWKTLGIATVAACALLAVALQAKAVPATVKIERRPNALVVPAQDVLYFDAGIAGVERAVVAGNSVKGPHHSFLRFRSGFSAGLHHHSADHFGAVVAGTLVLTIDGTETRLPPGSFFSFTGKAQHATRCEEGADCIVFIDSRETWDVVPAEAKPKMK